MHNDLLEFQLPGGLLLEGHLLRRGHFRALDGRLESLLLEVPRPGERLVDRVTQVLSQAVENLEGIPGHPEMMGRICPADRQYLSIQLVSLFSQSLVWLQHVCEKCGDCMDVPLDRSGWPVKQAGEGYPYVDYVRLDGSRWRFRIVQGFDQERLAATDMDAAVRELLGLCLLSVDGRAPVAGELPGVEALPWEEIEAIEAAMEKVSPAVAVSMQAACPECGHGNEIPLDPYGLQEMLAGNLYHDVHRLAFHYHWSEEQILDLPRARRKLYLSLIDGERGFAI